jgi:uncharacterized cupin superfamily protein
MTPNTLQPAWDQEIDRGLYKWQRAHLGEQAGARELGASIYDLPAGAATFPLHAHLANEELIVVLEGSATLESLHGDLALLTGEVVACPRGLSGAHRIRNHTAETARILIVSTMNFPDVNVFPNHELVWVRTGQRPDLQASDDAQRQFAATLELDPLSLE